MSTARALAKARGCHDLTDGVTCSFEQRRIILHAGLPWPGACRALYMTAGMVPLPGSPIPMASVRQFMELAVNMPAQEPQVGQAAVFDMRPAPTRIHFAGV
jgi:hypothetical protein